jgi:hypothetical protein
MTFEFEDCDRFQTVASQVLSVAALERLESTPSLSSDIDSLKNCQYSGVIKLSTFGSVAQLLEQAPRDMGDRQLQIRIGSDREGGVEVFELIARDAARGEIACNHSQSMLA